VIGPNGLDAAAGFFGGFSDSFREPFSENFSPFFFCTSFFFFAAGGGCTGCSGSLGLYRQVRLRLFRRGGLRLHPQLLVGGLLMAPVFVNTRYVPLCDPRRILVRACLLRRS